MGQDNQRPANCFDQNFSIIQQKIILFPQDVWMAGAPSKNQFENLSDKNLISPPESERVTQVAGLQLHSEREDQSNARPIIVN